MVLNLSDCDGTVGAIVDGLSSTSLVLLFGFYLWLLKQVKAIEDGLTATPESVHLVV